VQFFADNNIAGGPLNSLDELLEDPHFKAREPFVDYRIGEGTVSMLGTPVKVQGERFSTEPAPDLGQHSDQALREYGISDEKIKSLRAAGVVA
jgi:crotonobetainyl-CoA:carnitine CoA-transferase CaiB-like acyl-CoA transferase